MVNRRDYMGSVQVIKLNSSHAAVLTEGKVIVHPIEIEGGKSMDDFDVVLPTPGQNHTITCVAINETFVITGCKQVRCYTWILLTAVHAAIQLWPMHENIRA